MFPLPARPDSSRSSSPDKPRIPTFSLPKTKREEVIPSTSALTEPSKSVLDQKCLFDPTLPDPQTGKTSKTRQLEYRINGLGLTSPVSDPRSMKSPSLTSRANGRFNIDKLERIRYQYDHNSIGEPPAAPPSSILVTRLLPTTHVDVVRRYFSQFGKIQEFQYKLDDRSGQAWGIVWLKYIENATFDVVSGKHRLKSGTPGQLGFECADKAIKKANNTRITPLLPGEDVARGLVHCQLDLDGSKCRLAVQRAIEAKYSRPKERPLPDAGKQADVKSSPKAVIGSAKPDPKTPAASEKPAPHSKAVTGASDKTGEFARPIVPSPPEPRRLSYDRPDRYQHREHRPYDSRERERDQFRDTVPPRRDSMPASRDPEHVRPSDRDSMRRNHMDFDAHSTSVSASASVVESDSDEDESRKRDAKDQIFFPRSPAKLHSSPQNVRSPIKGRESGRTDQETEAVRTQLLANGNPHIVIDRASLASLAQRKTPAEMIFGLKAHFKRSEPIDVVDGAKAWYILFDRHDGARRAQVVHDRSFFASVQLHLTVHQLPTSPVRGDLSSGPVRQVSPTPARQSNISKDECIRRAREIISRELASTFEQDLAERFAPHRIREAVAARLAKIKRAPQAETTQQLTSRPGEAGSGDVPSAKGSASQHDLKSALTKLPKFRDVRAEAKRDRKEQSEMRFGSNSRRRRSSSASSDRDVMDIDDEMTERPKKGSKYASVELDDVFDPISSERSAPKVISPQSKRRIRHISYTPSESELSDPESGEEGEVNEQKAPSMHRSDPTPDVEVEIISRSRQELSDAKKADDVDTKIVTAGEIDWTSDEDRSVVDVAAVQADPILSDNAVLKQRQQDDLPIDPFEVGLAQDDEDLYYLRMALERVKLGRPLHPSLLEPEHQEAVATAHPTGSARTEGYYKLTDAAKASFLPQRNHAVVEADKTVASSVTVSRNARATTRRAVIGIEQSKKSADSDALNFNQLKARKKQLKFARSPIHDWGLYAMEPISRGDLVIEYVGEVIRQQIADRRERAYESVGIGSSYLFRIDDDFVVDATKKGSMSRLINHCCDPNCIAKIITINGQKKIAIYARQDIGPGDEITYDYKFAVEAAEFKASFRNLALIKLKLETDPLSMWIHELSSLSQLARSSPLRTTVYSLRSHNDDLPRFLPLFIPSMTVDEFLTHVERIRSASGDLYLVLDIPEDASPEEVKAGYKYLALLFHPDRIPAALLAKDKDAQTKATDIFKIVSEAYVTLSDAESRKKYDSAHQIGQQSAAVASYKERAQAASARRQQSVLDYERPDRNQLQRHTGQPIARRSLTEPAPRQTQRDMQRFDEYENLFGRQSQSTAMQRRNDPFSMFDDMFPGAFGGTAMPGDAGMTRQGTGSSQPQRRQADPFAMFDSMFGDEDPFDINFGNLSVGDNATSPRGGYATKRVTRRATNRHGDVSLHHREQKVGVIDMGSKGKVVVQSSVEMRGYRPSGGHTSGRSMHEGDFEDLDSFDSPANAPYESRSHSPEQAMRYRGSGHPTIEPAQSSAFPRPTRRLSAMPQMSQALTKAVPYYADQAGYYGAPQARIASRDMYPSRSQLAFY